jgi:hypothetical protein
VKIEFRWPEGQYARLPGMVADLIQRRVSVLERVGALGGADENDTEWQARIGWSFALENSTNVDAAERSTLFCRQTFSHLISPAQRNILAPAGKIILG